MQSLRRRKAEAGAQEQISGARFVAETLKDYGVTHIFFMESILRQALIEMEHLGIRRVLAHCEKAAAYMADGYARVSGKPGICMAQSVGAANLVAGLQEPYLALSPVIAITGRKQPLFQYRNAYQEILHFSMYDPVTKYNVFMERAEQLPFMLRQAFREATTGMCRPVHVDVMGHVGQDTDTAELGREVITEQAFTRTPALRVEPEGELVHEAVRLLREARQPVIVAGGGAVRSGAGQQIIRLAESLQIPVAVTLNGKALVPDGHPLKIGAVGSYGHQCANTVVSKADLVLFIGSRTGDSTTVDYTVPRLSVPVIQIDINPSELGRSYPNVVSLMGDARLTVARMSELVQERRQPGKWMRFAREQVAAWDREWESKRISDALPIRPERLCKELTDVLPANAVLVADTGHSTIWTTLMVHLRHDGQSYLHAAGTLGWAFPASLGVKCAAPDRPVVCFTGDGGFWYHLGELETARRCGIKTVTVINDNHILGQNLVGINKAYSGREGRREDLYLFRETNFARIAEEMGCEAIRIEQPEQIRPALEHALACDRPAVVDVVTDGSCMAPWTPNYSYGK